MPKWTEQSLQSQLNEFNEKYIQLVKDACIEYNVPIDVLFGIGSRESQWGLILKPVGPSGTGDFIKRKTTRTWRSGSLPPDGGGFGRGLLQIDYDAHDFARTEKWKDPKENIRYGCNVLKSNIKYIKGKFPNLSEDNILKSSISSYNCGAGNVKKALDAKLDSDTYTHGKDYAKDVLSRANWYNQNQKLN